MDLFSLVVVSLMVLVSGTAWALRRVARAPGLSSGAKSAWSVVGWLVILGLAGATWAYAKSQIPN